MGDDHARLRVLLAAVTDPAVPSISGPERVRRRREAREATHRQRAAGEFGGEEPRNAPSAPDLWQELGELLESLDPHPSAPPPEVEALADALEDLEEIGRTREKAARRRRTAGKYMGESLRLHERAQVLKGHHHGVAEELETRSRLLRIFVGRRRRHARRMLETVEDRVESLLAQVPATGPVPEAFAFLARSPASDKAWEAALDALEGRLEDLAREDLLRRAHVVMGDSI